MASVPIFFLSSGRSGTYQIYKYFKNFENIDSAHERFFEDILKVAIKYRLNLISFDEVCIFLNQEYKESFKNSSKFFWVDSSNALPWIIEPLTAVFPNAKFIHLARDGSKVVSSFYNKYQDIMYPKEGVDILLNWLKNPIIDNEPDPDKKIWRPLPNISYDIVKCNTKESIELIGRYLEENNEEIVQKKSSLNFNPEYFSNSGTQSSSVAPGYTVDS